MIIALIVCFIVLFIFWPMPRFGWDNDNTSTPITTQPQISKAQAIQAVEDDLKNNTNNDFAGLSVYTYPKGNIPSSDFIRNYPIIFLYLIYIQTVLYST
jgi:hypothetical protein